MWYLLRQEIVLYMLHSESVVTLSKNPNYVFSETAWPRSQFLHSCISKRFIYFQDRSAYLADQSWEYKIAHRDINVEIGRQNIIILFWK